MNIIKLPWEKERELNFIPIATGCGAFFCFFFLIQAQMTRHPSCIIKHSM